MIQLEAFFTHLSEFEHRSIFDDAQQIWDPLKNLGGMLRATLNATQAQHRETLAGAVMVCGDDPSVQKMGSGFYVERWIVVASAVYLEPCGILIGAGTVLEPGAIIKGPAIIGAHCEVRQGAYIRGNVLVGDHCVVGHNTEVKNSIIMNHSEAGHFNYIGDSIIGSYVNLGAGSRLANVQFRSLEEKKNGFIHPIAISLEGTMEDTGLSKFGSVLGDNVEIGCNAVLCPGTLMGSDNWVYPNTTVPKGYYPANHFVAPKDRKPRTQSKPLNTQ